MTIIEQFEAVKSNAKGRILASAMVNKQVTEFDQETQADVVTSSWKEAHQLIVMRDGSVMKQVVKNPALSFKEMARKDSVTTRETLEFESLPENVQQYIVDALGGQVMTESIFDSTGEFVSVSV